MLCLDLHGDGIGLANVFWGLWLLPFGLLVIRRRALPRILGAWLIADCCALVAGSLTTLLIPTYVGVVSKFAVPAELGELAAMLWLLTMGAKIQPALDPGRS